METTDMEILKEMINRLESGEKVALCTLIEKVGSGPREVGAKMVVYEDGETSGTIGGGYMELALIKGALKSLNENKSGRATFSLHKGERKGVIQTGLMCGGELTVFIDVLKPKRRIIMVGAGHVAWPLAKLADIVGFGLVVVDDNEELANNDRYPMAEKIITGNFTEILDKAGVSPNDYVVIVHGEPTHDYLALKKILKKRPAYVGLLGSKTKVSKLIERLREEGVSGEDLTPLHAPIGLDIGAQTPEEIGVSILAEIISEKRKHQSISS